MAEQMKMQKPVRRTKRQAKKQLQVGVKQQDVVDDMKPRKRGGKNGIRPQDGINTRFKAGEAQAKIASMGGQATKAKWQRKKSNKQLVLSLLQCRPDLPAATKDSLKKLGITGESAGNDPDDFTIQLIATAAVMQKAMKGDIKAYELMMAIIGEKPVQTVVVQKDSATTKEVEDMLFGGE